MSEATNPRSLHDAMRRISALAYAARLDLHEFRENPAEYDGGEYMNAVAEAVVEIEEIAMWVRNAYKSTTR
jgi:hypothetical protein